MEFCRSYSGKTLAEGDREAGYLKTEMGLWELQSFPICVI